MDSQRGPTGGASDRKTPAQGKRGGKGRLGPAAAGGGRGGGPSAAPPPPLKQRGRKPRLAPEQLLHGAGAPGAGVLKVGWGIRPSFLGVCDSTPASRPSDGLPKGADWGRLRSQDPRAGKEGREGPAGPRGGGGGAGGGALRRPPPATEAEGQKAPAGPRTASPRRRRSWRGRPQGRLGYPSVLFGGMRQHPCFPPLRWTPKGGRLGAPPIARPPRRERGAGRAGWAPRRRGGGGGGGPPPPPPRH